MLVHGSFHHKHAGEETTQYVNEMCACVQMQHSIPAACSGLAVTAKPADCTCTSIKRCNTQIHSNRKRTGNALLASTALASSNNGPMSVSSSEDTAKVCETVQQRMPQA